MFPDPPYRSWCVLVLLSVCIFSTVYGEAPVFDADPCVKEVNVQPDANKDEARAFWTFPTATDENSNPAAVSCDRANGGVFSGGSTPVNCTATDTTTTSLTSTCSFEVKVYPTFEVGCPSNTILETEDVLDFDTPIAVDSNKTNPAVTCTPPTGSSFSKPTTNVTCTATDTVLNDQQVSCTFIVSVGSIPTFDTPGSCEDLGIIDVQPDEGENTASVITWIEPVSAGSTVSCEPDPDTAVFEGGETVVTCTATDSITPSLISTCDFTVRVYPTFATACPDNIIYDTGGNQVFVPPTANTDSSGGVTPAVVSCVPASGSDFSDPSTVITCTATDSVLTGQNASCTFTISVGSKPVFDGKGSCAIDANTIDVSPDDGKTTASSIDWNEPSATNATVSCEPNPTSAIFQGGETPVTCTAKDTTTPTLFETCEFTVRVFPAFKDNKCVEDMIRQPGADGVSANVAWLLTATDKDGASVDVNCDPESGSSFTGVETDVVCKATDETDDSTCAFKVSIQPSFNQSCPENITSAFDSNGEQVVSWELLTGNDDTTKKPAVVTCNYENGATFNQPETLVMCVATDAGNFLTAECSFKVILVVDSTKPTFPTGCPDDDSVPAKEGSNKANHTWATPEATDDFTPTAEIKVSCIPASDSLFVFGSTAVTCVAIDSVGNTGVCDFTVNVTSRDECSPACNDSSTCSLSDKGVSECICNEGYTLLDGSQCANRDECELDKPCHAMANCVDLDPPDMFSCSCKDGYFGNGVYTCSSAPALFPDIDSTENLEKSFNVEIAIADSSVSSCDPVDAESIQCVALVTTFLIQAAPLYQQVSESSFIRIDVNQTSIRKGSVIIPHNVIYNYSNADIRGVSADEFYSRSIKGAVESGIIGSLAVVINCTACQDPEDHTDVCAEAQCTEGYTLSNDNSIGTCIPICVSVCSSTTEYCNGGSCIHEVGKSPVCSDCPSGTTGEKCKPVEEGPDKALIIGLSVGLGGGLALVILVAIVLYCVHRSSKKAKVNMSGDGGQSNDAMSMENAGVAT